MESTAMSSRLKVPSSRFESREESFFHAHKIPRLEFTVPPALSKRVAAIFASPPCAPYPGIKKNVSRMGQYTLFRLPSPRRLPSSARQAYEMNPSALHTHPL